MKQLPKNNKKIEDKFKEYIHIRENQDYIPIKDCVHGGLYLIRARNFDYGVYNEENKSFIGIRYKFGETFLFAEDHWDIGEPYGTVKPKEFIKQCPLKEINEGKWQENKVWKSNVELFNWIKEEINERKKNFS